MRIRPLEPDHEHVHTFLFLLELPWCDGAAFLFHPEEEHSDRRCCRCFSYTTSTCSNTPPSHLTEKWWVLAQKLVRHEGFLQVVARSQSQVSCVYIHLYPSRAEQSPVLPDQHISLKAATKTHMEWHPPLFYGEKLAAEHRLARRRQAAEMMLVQQSA